MTAAVNRLDIGGNREQYRRKHMKTLLLLLVTLGLASTTFAQANQRQETTLTGTLQGGRIAVGGESTGWALDYRDATGQQSVEVELPREVMARAKSGASVRLTGTFATREYVERGTVRIFRVSRLENVATAAAKSRRPAK